MRENRGEKVGEGGVGGRCGGDELSVARCTATVLSSTSRLAVSGTNRADARRRPAIPCRLFPSPSSPLLRSTSTTMLLSRARLTPSRLPRLTAPLRSSSSSSSAAAPPIPPVVATAPELTRHLLIHTPHPSATWPSHLSAVSPLYQALAELKDPALKGFGFNYTDAGNGDVAEGQEWDPRAGKFDAPKEGQLEEFVLFSYLSFCSSYRTLAPPAEATPPPSTPTSSPSPPSPSRPSPPSSPSSPRSPLRLPSLPLQPHLLPTPPRQEPTSLSAHILHATAGAETLENRCMRRWWMRSSGGGSRVVS